eukprot:566657-Amorphochlora_amoeboformis.AAC.1
MHLKLLFATLLAYGAILLFKIPLRHTGEPWGREVLERRGWVGLRGGEWECPGGNGVTNEGGDEGVGKKDEDTRSDESDLFPRQTELVWPGLSSKGVFGMSDIEYEENLYKQHEEIGKTSLGRSQRQRVFDKDRLTYASEVDRRIAK